MKKILFTFVLLGLTSSLLLAQSKDTGTKELEAARARISSSFEQDFQHLVLPRALVIQKAKALNIPITLTLQDGAVAELRYFDETDQPVYYKTMNVNAANTTGTVALQPNGSLGVNLTGKGMVVGVYDQTRPKIDHVEYNGRLTQVDGSTETISNHATHVTGTILASGARDNAKGMASEATGWAFNWESDLSKMNNNAYDPVTKPGGHLVSNHSYGVVLGWYRNSSNVWTWAGNPSIDPDEDYRFGFYSSKSKGLDDLIFSKPYYTVVWAAGNDRSDSGDGSRDPDGPDDTIGPEGVAKNVITVGAVSNVPDYTGSSSVNMSNFSSWGPTDDGRIKPDLVGMGVNVFSSAIADGGVTDAYATLSGTSMAAPNVSGSLLLLQQLYSQRNSGRFMWASTLKALALNTTKEAGQHNGPDYIYGWGLLDAEAAGNIILSENGTSEIIRELNLTNGETYEFDFVSDGVTPIRITIAWTDPSGTPVSASLDPQDLMLVNDLDMRITDEQGVSYFPWTLDPASGPNARAAQDKDNFRDNVEQILISSPKSQKYTVRVTHKKELVNSSQDFSLVMKAGTLDGAEETLYWIGGATGNWNSGSNWSLSSGGAPANKIPTEITRVVFEGADAAVKTVDFPVNASAFSVNLFGNQLVSFDLNGKQLFTSNGFRVSNQFTTIKNGTILFSNEGANKQLVELGAAVLENLSMNFAQGNWEIIDADQLDKMAIDAANVSVTQSKLDLNSLSMTGAGSISGKIEEISFTETLAVDPTATLKEGISIRFDGSLGSLKNEAGVNFASLQVNSGSLRLLSDGINSLAVKNSEVIIAVPLVEVSDLEIGPATTLNLGATGQLTVTDNILATATSSAPSLLNATAKGVLIHDQYKKYCFENISVSNLDLQGDAIINLGVSSTVINSSGWLQQDCADVLFANFAASFTCVGAAVNFENLSEGSISSYAWDFGGLGTSSLENPFFVFDAPGDYLVTLRVSNDQGFTDFDNVITVAGNELLKPVIVINGSVLTSQQPGSSYQWYKNGAPISEATSRSFEALEDGLYQVAIFSGSCNRISDPVVISAIPDQEVELGRLGIFIGPNPTEGRLNISISNEYIGNLEFKVIDMAGREYLVEELSKSELEMEATLDLNGPRGVYILQIQTNNLKLYKKLIKL
ncbi:S8 family serine peptidase [Algoriphagus sp. AGSA1]|uniref:S8 family serine peptidase n=1 Tax=Algoriphagus sp. AGSA1 TaxID=2907213 RepID=UPI001F1CB185|nr:S8 family serine peptidase [Algoriphagus sp. AGSA1]MCE7055633.1 S8 family serine peptidase [Algoriphagus sp. AGSA1]